MYMYIPVFWSHSGEWVHVWTCMNSLGSRRTMQPLYALNRSLSGLLLCGCLHYRVGVSFLLTSWKEGGDLPGEPREVKSPPGFIPGEVLSREYRDRIHQCYLKVTIFSVYLIEQIAQIH